MTSILESIQGEPSSNHRRQELIAYAHVGEFEGADEISGYDSDEVSEASQYDLPLDNLLLNAEGDDVAYGSDPREDPISV